MKILSFDTSNSTTSVAISQGQQILAYIEDLRPSMQAERLISMIEEALSFARLKYQDIDYLGVTRGPGSFTGIRIGLSAAKGLIMGSNNIKGVAVTNFDIAYYRAQQQIKHFNKIIILLNAFREQVYLKIFDENAQEPKLVNIKDIKHYIEDVPGTIVAGSGVGVAIKELENISNITILPRFAGIKALHICRYIDDALPSKQPDQLEPLYIRFADAKKPLC